MLTRVVAKEAKIRQQKSETILLMERKTSKEYSTVFLVEGENFNLSEKIEAKKIQAKSSICLRTSYLCFRFCSVGKPLEFAVFRSGLYQKPKI